MPWKETCVRDERTRFIARLLDGESMRGLCEEFGISRKTGYKIFDRYKDCGVQAFSEGPDRGSEFEVSLPKARERCSPASGAPGCSADAKPSLGALGVVAADDEPDDVA